VIFNKADLVDKNEILPIKDNLEKLEKISAFRLGIITCK